MRRLGLLGLVVVTACVRVVTPAQSTDTVTVKKPQGQACGDGEECATGHCQDAVCCDRACTGVEACNLERAFGSCAPRVLGDPCGADNARCRSGFCADGVCCESACNTPCHACAEPGQEGRCTLAADNSNPRNSCTAFCTACFGGFCAPALAGTDPGDDCTELQACAPPQSGVGPPECRTALGGSCTGTSNCASGVCLERSCQTSAEIPVSTAGVTRGALHVRAVGAAVDSSGQPSVVLRAVVDDTFTAGRVGRTVAHARLTAQGWVFTPLGGGLSCFLSPEFPLEPYQEDTVAQVVAVGTSQLVLLAQGEGCAAVSGILDYGAQAVWLSPTGQVSRRDALRAPQTDTNVQYLSAVFDGEDEVMAVLGVWTDTNGLEIGGVEFRVETQTFSLATGAWKPTGRISTSIDQWGPVLLLRGRPWIVAANTASSVAVYQPGMDAEMAPRATVDLPAGCAVPFYTVLQAAAAQDGSAAVVTARCDQVEESRYALVRLDVAEDGTPTLVSLGILTQEEDLLMGQAPLVPLGIHAGGADLAVFQRSTNQLLYVTTPDGRFTSGTPLHPRLSLTQRLDLLGSSTQTPRWFYFGASQVAGSTLVGVQDSEVWLQTFSGVPAP